MITAIESATIPANPPELTYGERLALKILAEPHGLGTGFLLGPGELRCVLDVVGDAHVHQAFIDYDHHLQDEFSDIYRCHWGTYPLSDNDGFKGTPKTLQQWMAARVRVLELH